MTTYNTILDVIGSTPIVQLNRVCDEAPGSQFFGKLEYMNPGGSIKDRLGSYLIADAEKKGLLKPGGTIIEGTSGNTGFGLAITSAIKGYKCIFVLPDKMSDEKIKNLRAFGARVVVTPTAVEPSDPRSYYSVAKRLAKESGGYYVNQYNNLANRECHYTSTGPEILKQMPNIDVLIAGIGTGGTICGTGQFFKEHKKDVEIVAVDPKGSIVYDLYKNKKEVPADSYLIEGIGEDFIPDNYDFNVIDDMVQVDDKESFLKTRELLVKEGLYCGVSSGAAVVGAVRWVKAQGDRLKGKNILVILPDSGNRYLSKVFDDKWMREVGFLESELGTVRDLLQVIKPVSAVVMAKQGDKIGTLIETMREKGISQIPVQDSNGWIKGVVTEDAILKGLYQETVKGKNDVIDSLIDSSIEFLNEGDTIEKASDALRNKRIPLVTEAGNSGKIRAIITSIDVLTFLESRQGA